MEKDKSKKILKTIGLIFTGLVCFCLVGIIILNISLFVSKKIGKEHQMGLFGIYPLVVKSDSMTPLFKKGDLIFSKKIAADEVKQGDVISFINVHADREQIVTHRIKRVIRTNGDNFFITKGDANASSDYYELSGNNILGKYMGRIPGIGYLIMFIQKPIGLILCLGSLLLIFIAFSLYFHYKDKKSDRYKPGYDGSI